MRKSEIQLEQQWQLYRRSVAQEMPDSEYKKAVLAGIAHSLMRLEWIEGSHPPFIVRRDVVSDSR
jgi:hypothetical protein